MNIDRRSFLKGALSTGAVAAAGVTLQGCGSAPKKQRDTAAGQQDVGQLNAKNYADIQWSFEIPPEPIAESEIKETIAHDIVVVGSGMAGLCAAVSAAEQGADIIVISAGSKAISRGGSNHAIGSKYQKAKGVTYTPEIAREIIKTEQTSGTYLMDKKKWERWINHSAESIDWTIDHMEKRGLKCCLEPGYTDPDHTLTVPPASHNFYTDEQPFGALFGAPLEAQAYADIFTQDFGGEIHFNTKALYLIRDDNNTGRVSAVVAQKQDGTYVKYVAHKAVVLATGDFSKDMDMMAKYSPWAYEHFKDVLSVGEVNYDIDLAFTGLMPGDGHKMGLWVGAAWQKTYPVAPMINGGATGPAHGVISNFWGLNMDIHGQRYQNECTNFAYGAISLLQLPQQTAYAVWDINYAYTQEEWEVFGCCIDRENGIMPQTPEQLIASWDKNVAGDGGSIGTGATWYKADTLEELVQQMDGIDTKAALETIKRYSQYAEAGLDEEFHVNPEILYPIKTPPFYATKTVGATFLTVCGGLRTNEKMQVCDEQDNPIPGLYNTGIMTGDFYANTYNFVMPGQNLGAVCGTLSYLLGRDLAEL